MGWSAVVILATIGVLGVFVAYFLGKSAERREDAASSSVTSVVHV